MTLIEAFEPRGGGDGDKAYRSEYTEQRPPVYNAEDYSVYLRKHSKLTGLQLYINSAQDNSGGGVGAKKRPGKSKDRDNNNSTSFNKEMSLSAEMGLKQFSSVSELLGKLKVDLHLSFSSFIKEFISEPNDGVAMLLDLLKVIQLSQTNISGVKTDEGRNHGIFKRALADEHETLLCLRLCAGSEDGARRLVDHPSGLFTIAVCVMSNFSKSRVLALQLLTRVCEMTDGHGQVSDAVSMLRLRFGEPVRFKFLIGMLNSQNSGAFQIACLRFLNTFISSSPSAREKVHIQSELEEAGFDIQPLTKLLSQVGTRSELLKEELTRWSSNYIDVNNLVLAKLDLEHKLDLLNAEIKTLRERNAELEQSKDVEKTPTNTTNNTGSNKQKKEDRWVEGRTSEWREGRGRRSTQWTGKEADWQDHSDQDSGKHSDNSLSQSDNWSSEGRILPGASAPGTGCPGTDTESDKSSYSEKQEKEECREKRIEVPGEAVTVTVIEDAFSECNVSLEETELVEAETITMDSFCKKFGIQDMNEGPETNQSTKSLESTAGNNFNSATFTKSNQKSSEQPNNSKPSSADADQQSKSAGIQQSKSASSPDSRPIYADVKKIIPKPARQRSLLVKAEPTILENSKDRSTEAGQIKDKVTTCDAKAVGLKPEGREGRSGGIESTVIASSDEEGDGGGELPNIRRTPRPPVRRRARSNPAPTRPRSTPISGSDIIRAGQQTGNSNNKRHSQAFESTRADATTAFDASVSSGFQADYSDKRNRDQPKSSVPRHREHDRRNEEKFGGGREEEERSELQRRDREMSERRRVDEELPQRRNGGEERSDRRRGGEDMSERRGPDKVMSERRERVDDMPNRRKRNDDLNRPSVSNNRDINGSRSTSRGIDGSRADIVSSSRDIDGRRATSVSSSRNMNGSRADSVSSSRNINGSRATSVSSSRDNNGSRATSVSSSRDVNGSRAASVSSSRDINGSRATSVSSNRDINGSRATSVASNRDLNGSNYRNNSVNSLIEEPDTLQRRDTEGLYSDFNTLETMSARSFGFVRPGNDPRPANRSSGDYNNRSSASNHRSANGPAASRTTAHNSELTTRIKRHKSFFNAESLRAKKNAILRRAESFHHDMDPSHRGREGRAGRAKSVDRLLNEDSSPGASLKKSKSMEFLKSKLFRRQSTKARPTSPGVAGQLGRSMSELRSPSSPSFYRDAVGHPLREMRERIQRSDYHNPSPSQVRISRSREQRNRNLDKYAEQRRSHQELYDWRKDTPFWNRGARQGGKKENARSWGLEESGAPPNWVPPSPGPPAWVPPHPDYFNPNIFHKSKEINNSWEKMVGGGAVYPGLHITQAVNTMYLPEVNYEVGSIYRPEVESVESVYMSDESSFIYQQDYHERSVVEITELGDLPLYPDHHQPYQQQHYHPDEPLPHQLHQPQVHQIPLQPNILDMPDGLY